MFRTRGETSTEIFVIKAESEESLSVRAIEITSRDTRSMWFCTPLARNKVYIEETHNLQQLAEAEAQDVMEMKVNMNEVSPNTYSERCLHVGKICPSIEVSL